LGRSEEALTWWNGDTGGVNVLDTVLIISGDERLFPVAAVAELAGPVAVAALCRELLMLLLNSSAKSNKTVDKRSAMTAVSQTASKK
jgi:hypothetical protein